MIKRTIALLATATTLGLAACGSDSTTASSSSSATGTTPAGQSGAPSGTSPGGQNGTPPQMETVTGAAATKVKAAALAAYPGTAGDVIKMGDGYVVRVTTSDGEKMVAVSAAYEVTGLQERPSGAPSGAAPSGAAPSGTTPSTTSATTTATTNS